MKKICEGLIVLLMMLSVHVCAATTTPPERVVADTAAEMLATLKAEKKVLEDDPDYIYELVNRIMIPHFDFPLMAKRVLGKHWRRANVQQRKDFTEAFRRLLVKSYAKSLKEYSETEIRYLPVRKKEGSKSVTVRSEVDRPGSKPLDVIYRLRFDGLVWKVFDVSIDGVSLVLNYRNSFSREITKGGLPSLIEKISKTKSDNEV